MCEWQLSRVADHGDKSELAYGDATLHATLRYTNVTSSNVVSMATAVIVALDNPSSDWNWSLEDLKLKILLPFQVIIKAVILTVIP